jgi:AraC-like DNA-binding protein
MVLQQEASDLVPFSEQHDRDKMPGPNQFIIERHSPDMSDVPFHHHTSIEINFLQGCDMTYSFSGVQVPVNRKELTIFWGARPHRVTEVVDEGTITNIYLSLCQFLRWGLPDVLTQEILAGGVLSTRQTCEADAHFFDRLWAERFNQNEAWRRMHLEEIGTRLRRLGLEGWTTRFYDHEPDYRLELDPKSIKHVDALLRFIADNFTRQVSVQEVADHVNLSRSRADALFRKVLGTSIKQQLIRSRLSHAKMLLQETNDKVVTVALDSGYRSLSTFYEAFVLNTGKPPEKFRRIGRKQAGRR